MKAGLALLILMFTIPAAGFAAAGSQPTKRKIQTSFGSVLYTVIGQNLNDKDTSPVLIAGLHGYGIDESQMRTLVAIEDLRRPYIYVAVRGFHDLGDNSYGWFPVSLDNGQLQITAQDLDQAVARLSEVLSHLNIITNTETERTFILGYSQGATLAIGYSLLKPSRIGGCAALAGTILPHFIEGIKTKGEYADSKLFIGHGTLDHFISVEGMRSSIEALRSVGVRPTYREYRIPHVVSPAQRNINCICSSECIFFFEL